jgi:hypothetical protein
MDQSPFTPVAVHLVAAIYALLRTELDEVSVADVEVGLDVSSTDKGVA